MTAPADRCERTPTERANAIKAALDAARPPTDEAPIEAGRRLAVAHCEDMGDWYGSYSPRNANSNAEGDWSEWRDLAGQILGVDPDEVRRLADDVIAAEAARDEAERRAETWKAHALASEDGRLVVRAALDDVLKVARRMHARSCPCADCERLAALDAATRKGD